MEELIYHYIMSENHPILKQAWKEYNWFWDKVEEVKKEFGAHSLFGLGRCEALVFEQTSLTVREGFNKPKWGDNGLVIYYPNKKSKIGKQVIERLNYVGGFNFSERVAKLLNIPTIEFGTMNNRGVAIKPSAGKYGDRLVIRFAATEEFVMPEGFTKLKESEFIAITKEGA